MPTPSANVHRVAWSRVASKRAALRCPALRRRAAIHTIAWYRIGVALGRPRFKRQDLIGCAVLHDMSSAWQRPQCDHTMLLLYYTILYYTIQYNTILYYTILYYTILYTIPILYSTLLCYNYYTLLYSTLLYSTLLYSTLLYSTLLYSTLLYSTLLYYTILYYTILYCTTILCDVGWRDAAQVNPSAKPRLRGRSSWRPSPQEAAQLEAASLYCYC